MAQLWYNNGDVPSFLNEIELQYDGIVQNTMKVAEVLLATVGVNNKWCDTNARLVALWWNQGSGKNKGNKLMYDEKKDRLILGTSGDSNYDGEDRMKGIVQAAARMYYLATSVPFRTLQSTHPEITDNVRTNTLYELSDPAKYKYASKKNITNTDWSDMMSDYVGRKRWNYTKLNETENQAGVTDSIAVNNMVAEIDKALANVQKYVKEYCEMMMKLINAREGSYWGFDEKSRQNLKVEVKDLKEKVISRLNSFSNNLNLALEQTSNNMKDALVLLDDNFKTLD